MTTAQIQLPPKLIDVFMGAARYRGAHGGRGSGKSFSFAKMTAVRGYMEPMRILCCRELQRSIKDSVHAEVKRAIESEPWLADFYEIGESFIRGKNGTEYIFRGLKHNISEIKSTSGIKICWVEEAEIVSEQSWRDLIPTIREEDSEIWVTWNPRDETSPTNMRFLSYKPHSSKIVEVNWGDNPWFPAVLDDERAEDKRRGSIFYNHIWEGKCLDSSGGLFDPSWIKWIKPHEIPKEGETGWFFDLAYSENEDADRTAGLITRKSNDGRVFQWGHFVGRHQWPVMKRKIVDMVTRTDVRRLRVDSTMSQVGFLNDLQSTNELHGHVVEGKRHSTNKIQNSMAFISRCEAGQVYWVDTPAAREYLLEMAKFSDTCEHDDCMDGASGGYEMTSEMKAPQGTSPSGFR